MTDTTSSMPAVFPWGAQYYRAPTPDRSCWAEDLAQLRALGCNHVKFWVQWRWSHRAPDRFVFADIDELMDLAAANELAVSLNVILDVAPRWLFERHPDALMRRLDSRPIHPRPMASRQIGGFPGPCLNHPGARAERDRFLSATVRRYRAHPAMALWDIWNEPKLELPNNKQARPEDQACACASCQALFSTWLQERYQNLETLNHHWGRWYESWSEVEIPLGSGAINDHIDFRRFQVDSMTRDARRRENLVRSEDPRHPVHLHVVPGILPGWNSAASAVDDFAFAAGGDMFAASVSNDPLGLLRVVSAAGDKRCLNVESHVNAGSINGHQRVIDDAALRANLLPQLGVGITGVLFWQYRPECLGNEAPAWGLVRGDGSRRPVSEAVQRFGTALAPHAAALCACQPQAPQIGIWSSTDNELLHHAMQNSIMSVVGGLRCWVEAAYDQSLALRLVNDAGILDAALAGLRLLILSNPYGLRADVAECITKWVMDGGTVICEAHAAGYDPNHGRHAATLPGAGLAERWGIREVETCNSRFAPLGAAEASDFSDDNEDVAKALADARATGGRYVPITVQDGTVVWGAERYAVLASDDGEVRGRFPDGSPGLVSRSVGRGRVIYAGSILGNGAEHGAEGLHQLLRQVAAEADIAPTLNAESAGAMHVDCLHDHDGPRFVILTARSGGGGTVRLQLPAAVDLIDCLSGERCRGDEELAVPAGDARLLRVYCEVVDRSE